jgi:hypothetical protein
MKREPASNEVKNPGHYDRWTCPACYEDLPVKTPGTYVCASCSYTIECSLDREPVCVSRLIYKDEVG